MRVINEYSHVPFLYSRLKNLLKSGSYAALAWQQIGYVIDSLFEIEENFEGRHPMSAMYPASSLFRWARNDSWFDIEWLRDDDGNFYDDKGSVVSPSIPITVSAVECMATYGLWLIEDDLRCCGPTENHDWESEPYNLDGWSEAQVANHQGECMLVAYQLLWYADRLLLSSEIQAAEVFVPATIDFAALGKEGAAKRHAKMKRLEEFALSLYKPSEWNSANAAAFELAQKIRDHGRTIGADLTPSNAQRTIAQWFRKAV